MKNLCKNNEASGETTVQVQIPGRAEYISIARQTVDALGEQIRLPLADRAAVRLAVGEACNNAVLHASRASASEGTGCVTVDCRVSLDTLEIDVTNEGNGFHPGMGARMPDPLSESGRGMALIEVLMDSVEYLSIQGNTVVRMRKTRPETSLA